MRIDGIVTSSRRVTATVARDDAGEIVLTFPHAAPPVGSRVGVEVEDQPNRSTGEKRYPVTDVGDVTLPEAHDEPDGPLEGGHVTVGFSGVALTGADPDAEITGGEVAKPKPARKRAAAKPAPTVKATPTKRTPAKRTATKRTSTRTK